MKNKIWYAYELLAYIHAGLVMTEVDGELDWMGRSEQFTEAHKTIDSYETFAV